MSAAFPLERVAAWRLKKYMNTRSLHGPPTVQNDPPKYRDEHGIAILVPLDLNEAFDTIDEAVLLDRTKTLLGIDVCNDSIRTSQ